MPDFTLPLDRLPDPLPVPALAAGFDATFDVPGSKSITCRASVLAALAAGTSRLARPLRADDTDRLLAALTTLGATADREGDDVVITGVGGRFPRGGTVDLGDGGTPARFLIACACLAEEPVIVDGSPRLRERPVAEGVEMLRALGARLEYVEAAGRLPVRVVPGHRPRAAALEVGRTASSQFVSALMLIAPWLDGDDEPGLVVRFAEPPTSASYLRLTSAVLARWGADVTHDDGAIRVARRPLPARADAIEPDASSAAYWLAAAAVVPGAHAVVRNLGPTSVQPDAGVLEPLAAAGLVLAATDVGLSARGPRRLAGFTCDAELMPDGALALAAVAACADGPTTITGLRTLRVKETDRIAALAAELRRIGCAVEADDDALRIDPRDRHDRPVVIRTYDDHRMAMAFAVLGLARGGVSIENPACVAKSYPGFWRDLARLYAAPAPGHTGSR